MKDRLKKRKNFKGMTLYEIIISLAIVSIMTVILITTSSLIDKYTTSSKNVNTKVAEQVPKAETKYTAGSYGTDDDLRINVGGVELKAKAYRVIDPSEPTDSGGTELGGNLSIQFIDDIESVSP